MTDSAVERVPRAIDDGRRPQRAVTPELTKSLILTLLSFGLYVAVALSQRVRGLSPSWDLSIFTQIVSQYSHGNMPIVSIKGDDFNILGDHFSPVLLVLAPIFGAFPSPLTLQIAQAILLSGSVFVIARSAMSKLGSTPGFVVGAGFALSFGILNAVDFQFHEIAFGVLFASLAISKLLDERWSAAAGWSMALVLVKEDLGLTCATLGIIIFLRSREKRHLGVTIFGLAAFVVVTFVVIPSFATNGWLYTDLVPIDEYRQNPLLMISRLFDDVGKLKTLALLLGVSGVIGLRSPLALALIPTLLWRFLSDNPNYYSGTFHYDAILMPIAFGALIDASSRTLMNCRASTWLATSAPGIAAAVVAVVLPTLPVSVLATPAGWSGDGRGDARDQIVTLIPNGATVDTDIGLMDRLVATRHVSYLGNPPGEPREFILVDKVAGGWGATPPSSAADLGSARYPSQRYESIYEGDGFSLARSF